MNTTVGQANVDSWTWPTSCEWSLGFGFSHCKFYQPSMISCLCPSAQSPFPSPGQQKEGYRSLPTDSPPLSLGSLARHTPLPITMARRQVSDWGCGASF